MERYAVEKKGKVGKKASKRSWRELADPGSVFSVGIIPSWEGRLLFAIGSRKYWTYRGEKLFISFWGLGGRQETGETILDTLRREVAEEAHGRVVLRDSPLTFLLTEGKPPEPLRLEPLPAAREDPEMGPPWLKRAGPTPGPAVRKNGPGDTAGDEPMEAPAVVPPGPAEAPAVQPGAILWAEPFRPLFFWKRVVELKDDAGQIYPTPYLGLAFLGELTGGIEPGAEIPGLLALSPPQLLAAEGKGLSWSELVQGGALFLGPFDRAALSAELGRPSEIIFFPQGAAGYLARLLKAYPHLLKDVLPS